MAASEYPHENWPLMELLTAIAAGIALAAACGFRVFLPLMATSIAAKAGYIHPSGGFEWLDSNAALALFGAAAVAEVAAYYIPWIDHALDTIATPAAVIAGTVVAAAAFGDLHPAVKWSSALIAGGGAAAAVQGGTVATRAVSGGTTGGFGNPIVATLELIASVVMSILAIVLPILALVVTIVLLIVVFRVARRFFRMRRQQAATSTAPGATVT
jgi:hypothetical protein